MLAQRHVPGDLNLAAGQRLSVALVYLLLGALGVTCRWPAAWAGVGIGVLGLCIINRDLYGFFGRTRGWWFALRAVPLHWLYFGYCGAAVGLGITAHAWEHWKTAVVLSLGAAIHVGTAALRLGDVVHPARMKDFAGVYTAAWAMRHGLSPYAPPPADMLETLRVEQQLAVAPSPMLATPLWPWLFQPLTVMSFPLAAWLWLVGLLVLVGWSAIRLARIAGCTARRDAMAAALLVVTFGPVVLSLTLGQSSPLLLVAALAVGRALHRGRLSGSALALWGLGVAAKLFPVLWAVALPLLRHARAVVGLAAAAVVAVAAVAVLEPSADVPYARYVGDLTWRLVERPDLDDQSLPAWVHRVGRPQAVVVHGVAANDQDRVQWTPPWAIEPAYLTAVACGLLGVLGIAVAGVLWRVGLREPEAVFYLWVLYTLLPVPHTMRYNHVLLLPAIAWLWGRGVQGRGYASAGYLLAALSRLTHVWALLAAPWGPLTSGFGLAAVCVLGGGMARELGRRRERAA
jgi:alpha-1,2-mannosyltransferase